MKNLCLLIAMLVMAISSHAAERLLFFAWNGTAQPLAHIWNKTTDIPYVEWNESAQNMTLISKGDNTPTVYAYKITSDVIFDRVIIHGEGSQSGDLTIPADNSIVYVTSADATFKNSTVVPNSTPKWSLYADIPSIDGKKWTDHEFKYVDGTATFQTGPITLKGVDKDAEFLIKLDKFDGTGTEPAWMHPDQTLTETNAVTCNPTGQYGVNGRIDLAPGTYRFVLDLSDLGKIKVSAVKEVSTIILDCTACAIYNQGPILYNVKKGGTSLYDSPIYMAYDAADGKWHSATDVDNEWLTGATVTFYTADGSELLSQEYNNQAEFTAPALESHPKISLIYSHLKNTYDIANGEELQIEPELYREGTHPSEKYSTPLIYTSASVKYAYVVTDPQGEVVVNQEPATQPYYPFKPTVAGVYTVKVTAEANGNTYTAYDTYPVYNSNAPANAPQTQSLRGATAVSSDKYYFWNALGWEQVACYRWKDNTNHEAEWPGLEVTAKNQEGLYELVKDPTYPNIIWNNNTGTQQTDDLTDGVSIEAGKIFAINGITNGKYTGSSVTYAPQEVTVYFNNTANWSNVYAYAYCGDLNSTINGVNHKYEYTASGHGNALTETTINGQTYYTFTYTSLQAGSDACSDIIVFSDGSDSNKTDVFNVVDGLIYSATGIDPNAPVGKRLNPATLSAKEEAFSISDITAEDGGTLHVNDWSLKYNKKLTVSGSDNRNLNVVYSWSKFEDRVYNNVSYDDNIPNGTETYDKSSDNNMVPYNDQPYNYCINYHPACYRVYMAYEGDAAAPASDGGINIMANVATANGTGDIYDGAAAVNGDLHTGAVYRVARTFTVDNVSDATTGVADITADDADNDAPVEYFNLNGQRINADNLTPGVYLRRQGSAVTKLHIR